MRTLLASLLIITLVLSQVPYSVYALEDTDISLTFNWSSEVYYSGDYGNVSILLQSKSSNELVLKRVRLAFIGGFYYYRSFQLDLSHSPITVEPNGSCNLPSISFYLHTRDPEGPLEYQVILELEENSTLGWMSTTWCSSRYTIIVHGLDERLYLNSSILVEEKLAQAKAANFSDSYARHLLQQSIEEKSLATQLSQEARWSEAVKHIEEASRLLEQAFSYEKLYWKEQASTALSSLMLGLNQTNLQGGEAEALFLYALSKAEEAKSAYGREEFKSATLLAISGLELLEKAVEAERADQNRRRYLTTFAVSGIIATFIGLAVFIFIKHRKSPNKVAASTQRLT